MKRLICLLAALMIWLASGAAFAGTDESVRRAMQDAVLEIAGSEEGYLLDTMPENAAILAEMNCWFLSVSDDYILLETTEDAYLAPIWRDDPVEALALALAYKAAFHDFVAESIIVFVEWTGMDSIIVDDESFHMQVETLNDMGYGQLKEGYVLALRRQIAESLGLYVTDSSFTYYDRYVQTDEGGNSSSKEVCFNCHGSGKCQLCGGDGLYNNPYTGDLMECTCYYGVCITCDGTGWW